MPQHGQFHPHHTHSHAAVLPDPYSSSQGIGSAVAASINLQNAEETGNTNYKIEHDLMYYSVSIRIQVHLKFI
jgi:hypothetical protein